MLSIEPSKNAVSAIRYFRESLAVEDYYSEKKEITGDYWLVMRDIYLHIPLEVRAWHHGRM